MRATLLHGLLALCVSLPVTVAPDLKKPAAPDDAADIADKLLERMDFERLDKVPLRTALNMIQEKIGYTILVDHKHILAVRGDDGTDRQVLEDQPISVPGMKRVRIETVLRQVLDQIDADFYIAADHVKVTSSNVKKLVMGTSKILHDLDPTYDPPEDFQLESRIIVRHSPAVTLAFRDLPLTEALKQLSARSGQTAIISADAMEKARANLTISLANVPFEVAVSNLAEAAGLRAFRNGASVAIVTPERALQREKSLGGSHVGGCCSFSSGYGVKLEELETIARLFGGKMGDPDGRIKELEAKVRTLTDELQKARTKN